MQDNELSELLFRARSAAARLDTARAELAFETRMQSVIRHTARGLGPEVRFRIWQRWMIGLAAVAGILMSFFISGREGVESADTLTAFWTDSAAAWDLQLFD